jgi:hypothetical protein
LPTKGTLFDWRYSREVNPWIAWQDAMPKCSTVIPDALETTVRDVDVDGLIVPM